MELRKIHEEKKLKRTGEVLTTSSVFQGVAAETHTKRRATQHGCLPSWLGDGFKGIEIVYGEEKNIFYWAN
jgi:hypothetical protein